MVTKHYAFWYAFIFILTFVPALVVLALGGRVQFMTIVPVLIVAVVLPPVLIWLAQKMGYPIGQAVRCPKCGAEMPMFRKPSSMSQALHGGYQCHGCGANLDARGREIAADAARRQ